MSMDVLEEFVTLSKYLNITKAAQSMHMSQSSLSRHISQMEFELGFSLVERDANKLTLSPAGRLFAEKIGLILSDYHDVINECMTLSNTSTKCLVALDPPYSDESANHYFIALRQVANWNKYLTFNYIPIIRNNLFTMLAEEKMDFATLYCYGKQEDLETTLTEQNLAFSFLSKVPLGVWCNTSTPLAEKEYLEIADIENYQILSANDNYRPLGDAIESLFLLNGLTAHFHNVSSASQSEFMEYCNKDCIFIFPFALRDNAHLSSRSDIVCKPLGKNDSLYLSSYLVTSADNGLATALLEQLETKSKD